jgi:hypothetical protein
MIFIRSLIFFSIILFAFVSHAQMDSLSNDIDSANTMSLLTDSLSDSTVVDTVPKKTEEEMWLDSVNTHHKLVKKSKSKKKKSKKAKRARQEAKADWAGSEEPVEAASEPVESDEIESTGGNDPIDEAEKEGVPDESNTTLSPDAPPDSTKSIQSKDSSNVIVTDTLNNQTDQPVDFPSSAPEIQESIESESDPEQDEVNIEVEPEVAEPSSLSEPVDTNSDETDEPEELDIEVEPEVEEPQEDVKIPDNNQLAPSNIDPVDSSSQIIKTPEDNTKGESGAEPDSLNSGKAKDPKGEKEPKPEKVKEPKPEKVKEPKAEKEPKEKEPFSFTRYGYGSLGVGYGFPIFIGDLKDKQSSNIGNKAKGTVHINLEKKLTRYFGAGIDFMNGRFSQHERSLDRNLNFSSKFTQIGLSATGYLDWEEEDTDHLIPFVKAGISWFKFDPYGDMKDANGVDYHYWSNGEIRDLPEFDSDGNYLVDNKSLSSVIERDYTYESQLTTSSDEGQSTYKRTSIAVPLTFGFTYKLWNPLSIRMYGQYNLLFTDYVDNHASGGNDSWMFLGFSANYRFGVETKGAGTWTSARDGASGRPIDLEKLSDRDFRGVEDDDLDNDGVIDLIDRCPNTPDSIKVNSKGCPSDRDRDGIPDYLDREPNSRRKIVDPYGVALTDENYEQMLIIRENALDLEIKEILSDAFKRGSISGYDLYRIETIVRVHKGRKSDVPKHLIVADTNQDGFISTNEITESIDCYFEGTCEEINASKIIELIDYFFQQATDLDD